ncbi:MAG TPA: EAL domain-containing protein [Devosia sp.]|uniref:EAL domain-containing protein n=1 Tax=Devosia sp. TaxID=1871048 RepID=UPI002DDDB28C|nr:EAL domain-containing protein [Devosia sp.]HEV2514240.1 EAL domain-containing protein [Devosia sp.]
MRKNWPIAPINVLAVLVPVIVSAALAYQVSFHDQRNRAQVIAEVVLNRSELITMQLETAFARLAGIGSSQACSAEAIGLMRESDLSSSLLQGLGYVENDRLECSSLGEEGVVEVGPPDYVSATGAIIRSQRTLPTAPNTPLLLVTIRTGYTGIVHPGLIFSLSGEDGELLGGTVGYSTRENIVHSGPTTFDWKGIGMPADQYSGSLVLADQLVGWQRSTRWDQFAYAGIPLAAVGEQFRGLIGIFLAGGLLSGVGLLALFRRLAASRASLPSLLRIGLARGEVHTVYQPIVDMRTGSWVGAEVLARWQRPSGEWIGPDVFVPIAEKHGLMRQLTRHVMTSCANDLRAFVAMAPDFFVSVNITAIDLHDPDFVKLMVAECNARGVAPHRVHLEITERVEVDSTKVSDAIRLLREHGFEIGIDDFGIGYSNLAYLDKLDVDYLKIDKVFVAGLGNGAIGTATVDHIIELAAERGLTTIAEGVELECQRAELVVRGVLLGQGWLFGRPMSASKLLAAYAEAPQVPVMPLSFARLAG